MEPWSAHEDDRPYLKPAEDRPYIRPTRSFNPWIAVVAIGVAAWVGAFYVRYLTAPQPTVPAPVEKLAERPVPVPVPAPAAPTVDPAQAAPSLPSLENSDALMRESVVGLIGRQAFEEAVVPVQLVRRIVATVDNLPRRTAPTRVMPLNAVPGAFTPDASNPARYAPYVRVLESLDAGALVRSYVRTYPLFQRAYEELGFPGKYFHARLMEAIDDLLAAPGLESPPELLRPRVLYEFADPDLETRSAGQKILMRMGRDNAARVKQKLREVRRELMAVSRR